MCSPEATFIVADTSCIFFCVAVLFFVTKFIHPKLSKEWLFQEHCIRKGPLKISHLKIGIQVAKEDWSQWFLVGKGCGVKWGAVK